MKLYNVLVSLLFILITYPIAAQPAFADKYDPQKASAERVKRQLALANKMKAERLDRELKIKQREKQKEKLSLYCAKSTDTLKQYEQARLRWYSLDKNSEREYLTAKQLEAKKANLRTNIKLYCQ